MGKSELAPLGVFARPQGVFCCLLPVEQIGHALPYAAALCDELAVVFDGGSQRPFDRCRIGVLENGAERFIGNEFGDSADACHDGGCAACGGFKKARRESFRAGGETERVCLAEQGGHILLV